MTGATAETTTRLAEDLRGRVFRLGSPPRGPERVGIEVELIPVREGDGGALPLEADDGRALGPLLRTVGERTGWRPDGWDAGWSSPAGGRLTLEPGGQIEYSSTPRTSVDAAVAEVRGVVEAVLGEARDRGVRLVTRGIDPANGEEGANLVVRSDRYVRLARHLARKGPAGRRMMLRTAAIHVNLDLGPDPGDRWRVANRLAPYVVALFANSTRFAGRETGYRSFRARQWQRLDRRRTGAFGPGDPVSQYLAFALEADAILLGSPDEPARPFREWLGEGLADEEAWRGHLTTLFPEIRPRGYLEVRCVDALPPRWYAAPPVFLAGILLDPDARCRAEALLPDDGRADLHGAARTGVTDSERAHRALDLFDLALEGAGRLGPEVVGDAALATARAFRDRYPARGEDPAGDPGAGSA